MKSADISFQGPGGVLSSFNFLAGAWLDPLKCADHIWIHSLSLVLTFLARCSCVASVQGFSPFRDVQG